MKLLEVRIVVPVLPIATPDPFATGLGGSETAGLQLAAALARKGHRITVYCNITAQTRWHGVTLAPIQGG